MLIKKGGINMKSILPDGRPALTALIYGGDLQQVKEETAKIIQQGADIIGFMLESYESDCRPKRV